MKFIHLLKKQEVSQAALFYIEGELMNVIVKEANKFHAGDSIICLLDSHKFHTKIIKIQEHNIYLYVPWAELQNLNDRRRAIRIPFHTQAQLIAGSEMITAHILDVSINGLGFESNRMLHINERYKIIFRMEGKDNQFEVIIKNQQQTAARFRYGALFINTRGTDLFHIRRYILKEQLEKLAMGSLNT